MKVLAIVLSLFLVSYGYSEINFDGNSKMNIKESISEVSVPFVSMNKKQTDPNPELKEWTIMVFVNAKNNLESYGLSDVNEMEMVGSTNKINIIAELGRINGYSTVDGDWKGCKRFYVTKDNDKNKITSPVILENPKCDMGSWEYMVDFVKATKEKYPAKKYILVVWNHGSGWDKGGSIVDIINKGISYDDETHNHITTQQLKMALEKIGGVNILAMDACLMQMIEVAYEVKDYAEYIVASEETEPADGYTYNTWLEPLSKDPAMDSRKLSIAIVDSYIDYYQSIGKGVTQSSLNAKALSKFVALSDEFLTSVMTSNDLTNAKNARTNAQKFYYSSNKDFYHFVKLVTDTTQITEVKNKGLALMGYIKNELVAYNRTYGSKYSNAYGLAVYLPTYYTTSYDDLMWAKDSKWDDFIKWIK